MTHSSRCASRGVNRVLRTIEPWISIGNAWNGTPWRSSATSPIIAWRVSSHSWRLRSSCRSNGWSPEAAMIGRRGTTGSGAGAGGAAQRESDVCNRACAGVGIATTRQASP